MTRRLNLFLLAVLLATGLPFYWNFLDSSLGSAHPRPVTIGQLRALAGAIPGGAPLQVRHEMLGHREVIRDIVLAGGGLRRAITVMRAYQILLADGRTIAVDQGISARRARDTGMQGFDAAAQRRVDAAVSRASLRVLLARPADATARVERGRPAPPLDLDLAPRAIAPGVVVIPLDDVAPQLAMLYVRLASGHELLLTGDVAPYRANWAEPRPPSRYYATRRHGFDRSAQIGWLMTINELHRQAPQMTILEGRDPRVFSQAPRGFIP